MKSRDCGPIVEQATHFIDLSRYFGGDVVVDSVQAHALGTSVLRNTVKGDHLSVTDASLFSPLQSGTRKLVNCLLCRLTRRRSRRRTEFLASQVLLGQSNAQENRAL